jgi:hypothetical protein
MPLNKYALRTLSELHLTSKMKEDRPQVLHLQLTLVITHPAAANKLSTYNLLSSSTCLSWHIFMENSFNPHPLT